MRSKMHTNMRNSYSSFAFKALTYVFALFVLTLSSVHAAGLGKLTVLSSLGQPLRAEIELTSVAVDEMGTIVVKVASHEAYRKANLEFNPVLQSLRFSVEKRGARQIVRLTSAQALNEPFVGMLLELNSSSGRLTREYTFLLDPAELRTSTSAVAAAQTPSIVQVKPLGSPVTVKPPVSASEKPAKPAKTTKAEAKAAKAAAAKAAAEEKAAAREERAAAKKEEQAAAREEKAAKAAAAKAAAEEKVVAKEDKSAAKGKTKDGAQQLAEYKTKKGDTLAVIVKKNKPEGISLEQMLVATYRENTEAFIGNNMNRLRVGRVLMLPDAEKAGDVTKSEARKEIVAQAADFASYRAKLAEQVAQTALKQPDVATQGAGGKISAKVEERPTAAKESKDKLKLSKASAVAGARVGEKAPAGAVSAEDMAAKEKAEADEKARVKELEKNVSDLQRVVELKNQQMAAAQKQAAEQAAAQKLAEEQAAAAAQKAAVSASAKSAPSASVPAASVASVPTKPVIKKFVPPPPPPPPSFLDEMLDNPIMLGGIGLGVLLIAYIVVRSRRKKPASPSVGGSMVSESRESPNSLFGSAGGQSVDTNNSIFNSGFTPSASLLDANEVDPVAEADVYIAYGRESQAIEILKEALRSHPERNALRVKLLEIYASQKDVNAFDMLAGEMYGLTKGEGEEWVYVAGMGVAIDPTNPLYAGGDMSEELLERPTSLQGSMTQPTPEHDPEVLLETSRKQESPAMIGDVVLPTPDQVEHPDMPLDLVGFSTSTDQKEPLDFDFTVKEPIAEANKSSEHQSSEVKAAPESLNFELSVPPLKEEKSEVANMLDFDLGDFSVKKDVPSADGVSVKEVSASDFDQMLEFKPATDSKQSNAEAAVYELEADLAAADRELASIKLAEPYAVASEEVVIAPQSGSAKAAASLDFNFGDINLDLAPTPSAAPESKPKSSPVSSSSVEMDTKIELAAAYLGIGDKEGARELLDEVIQEGSAEQVEKAKEALSKIS